MGYTTIRIPDELLERADSLVDAVGKRRELISYARLSKAAVVRLALTRGLSVLEDELSPELRELDAEEAAACADYEKNRVEDLREWAGLPPANNPKGGTNGK